MYICFFSAQSIFLSEKHSHMTPIEQSLNGLRNKVEELGISGRIPKLLPSSNRDECRRSATLVKYWLLDVFNEPINLDEVEPLYNDNTPLLFANTIKAVVERMENDAIPICLYHGGMEEILKEFVGHVETKDEDMVLVHIDIDKKRILYPN